MTRNHMPAQRIIAVHLPDDLSGGTAAFNRLLTATCYLVGQLAVFCRLLTFLRRNDIVYIDSMMPFGAALAGWVRRKKVVYHIHRLPHPDQCPETYGMTILGAMCYGLPVIVPPVGDAAELVEDGVNGLYVDSKKKENLITAITLLAENRGIYIRMSGAAWQRARLFAKADFDRNILNLFETLAVIRQPQTRSVNRRKKDHQ